MPAQGKQKQDFVETLTIMDVLQGHTILLWKRMQNLTICKNIVHIQGQEILWLSRQPVQIHVINPIKQKE